MTLTDFIIDPKDARRILIGASGKLGPTEFAQGLVAIVAVAIVLQFVGLLPVIGGLISLIGGLLLLFCWICVFAKRFHDAGQSGWMAAAALLAMFVISIVLSFILTPIALGGSMMTAGYTPGPGVALVRTIVYILANGAVGFYAYRLKPAAV